MATNKLRIKFTSTIGLSGFARRKDGRVIEFVDRGEAERFCMEHTKGLVTLTVE